MDMRSTTRLCKFACGLAMLCAATGIAHAQAFAGRVVEVVVNFTPGGPTDIEGRVFADHLPRFLKGVSAVVVRNIPGAGGLIGVNQFGEVSEKNKLRIGFFTWDPMQQVLKNPNLRVQFNDFKFIAGMQQTNLLYIRRDTAPGIEKPADITKAHQFNAGVVQPADWSTLRLALALDLLGVKYRLIPGYKGMRDADLAFMQGDVQLVSNSLPGYYGYIKPSMVDKGLAIPVLQFERGEGNLKRSPDLPDVPTFLELYHEVNGANANPSGEKWEALQLLNRSLARLARVIFMPPNAPDAAVAELRTAVENMSKDPKFIAAYEKVALTPPHFVLAADGEQVLTDLKKVSPETVTFFNKYIQAFSSK
jgi:tripartite-type tricarboxylate transporter receptor subunit TctC